MKIAVITIGDELLNGDVVDTNTADIARALRSEGYVVDQAITLTDNPQQIAATLQHLNQQNILALVCGGLGPTRDDVTARAAAQGFHLSLTLSDLALKQIEAYFQRAGKPFPPGNEKQALIPHKAMVMENRCGTAPGFIITHNNCPAFFMPGVPHEMREMFQQHVIPWLRHNLKPSLYCAERILKVFGLPESDIERQLPADILPPEVQLSFRLEYPLVLVKINSSGNDESALDQAEQLVRQRLGRFIVAQGDETLPDVVTRDLIGAEKTLSLAESCTGGLIAKLLTDQPGSSAFLERGIVSYANSAKHDCLGVSNQLLLKKGAVSAECARAMANGIRQRAKTDLALAVTGIAGPGGGSADKPCGTVFIALATHNATDVHEYHFSGDRQQVRIKTAYTAIDWLRRTLNA
ncbi:MAG: CinA family nicotinamide mononucleotide deamidase-related protein [Desulfuromonas sp.]|nr:CinA family nicotinamide mononucleotide deamidase-related protein [Desulfuromonas sp.]